MVARADVVLVDLTFLLGASEKSFHGAPLLLGPQGEDYTVLYGVARDLLRLRKCVGIRNAIVVIGSDANTVSSEPNVNNVLRFLRQLRTAVVYEPKVRVGSLCRCLAAVARRVVTQNKALFQLVSHDFGVIVPDKAAGGPQIVTVESLKTRLGIRPEQVPSFLALTEGGKKALFTKRQAIRLLEVHRDLGELLQDISVAPSKQMRRQLGANEKVLLGRLSDMTFKEVCQLPEFGASEFSFIEDDENSRRILREYGFLSLVRLLLAPTTTSVTVSAKEEREVAYNAIQNEAGMRALEALVSKSKVCAVDTEASDKDPRRASLFGVAFSVREGQAFYVPVTKADLEATSPEVIQARLRQLFTGRTRFVGHNLKYDCVLLQRHGITIRHAFFDTMLAAYECFGDWEFFNLSALAKRLLGKDIKRYRDIVGQGETLLDVPFNELLAHACADADTTLRLYHRLQEELEKRGLLEQFSDEAMSLLRTLVAKECNGVRLAVRAVYRRRKTLAEEAEALRGAIITEAGKEFDLDSPTETARVLREISPFGEQVGRRPLTLIQLEQLAGRHSLPRLIVKYNRVQKLIGRLDAISGAVKDGKIFPIFSQVRWAHGGLSSKDPRICEPDGPLDAAAVMDKVVREWMADWNRSLDILQRVTRDGVLKRDRRGTIKHPGFIGTKAPVGDLEQRDLLLSLVIGVSDAALCRRFLIDPLTVVTIRKALEARYVKLFSWLDTYRRNAVAQGFASHHGKRKYLQGLRSSDINKRQKAVRSAVRWLISY